MYEMLIDITFSNNTKKSAKQVKKLTAIES